MGRLARHGSKKDLVVLMFYPEDMSLSQKIHVRGRGRHSDSYSMVSEGMFVKVTNQEANVIA